MRREVVTILPLFAFWAEEDLISENWFEWHVISGDGKRSSLTNRELTTITRPIEQNADHIDHLIGNLRDMVWREFKDWPRVQKGLPASPRSPTPEAVTNGPIPEAPTDRPELVAAVPSGNGDAATGGTPLAGSGRDFEALAAAPENSMPKAPKSDLLVDDLAVAAWTRLSTEKGRAPSIARVAREIGHTRQHLYRCRHFMSLVAIEKAERDERKQRLSRGWKEPSGKVEACQDEDWGDT